MKALNHILIIIFFTTPNSYLFATGQIRDKLIYGKDTLSIRDFPLEQLYNNHKKKPDFFDNLKTNRLPQNTGCWRGYQANWVIIDNQLYLTSINSCCPGDNLKTANLKHLFGSRFINGKVKADWFSGRIVGEIGIPLLQLNYVDFLVPYEREFTFKNGLLTETKLFDNTRSKNSIYFTNSELLEEYIYNNINWPSLPEIKGKEIKVSVSFYANENGIIDSAFVQTPKINAFDQESIRVIKSIPEWNIYLREGKVLRSRFRQTIIFNEKMKKKYNKQFK